MKTIGILTLVSADNCGSLLQAYAMKQIIADIAGSAELINYWPYSARKLYRTIHPSLIKNPRLLLRTFVYIRSLINQKKDYGNFRKTYLRLKDDKIYNIQSLTSVYSKYDKIVVGSDQVWNVNMFDFDDAYFFNDFKGCKISYAASLGGGEQICLPPKLVKFKSAIEDFSHISVREPQGKKTLQLLIDKDIAVCIDPTLLLSEQKWNELAGKPIVDNDYIFYYSYNYGDEDLCRLVCSASQTLGLPVYVINATRWIKHRPEDYGFSLCPKGGPLAFLTLMKHAKYCFVQSLHGAIFASIFKRDYWFLNNREQDIIDQRSENILSLLGTRHRTLRPNNFSDIDMSTPLAYSSNNLLESERKRSLEWLKNAIAKR